MSAALGPSSSPETADSPAAPRPWPPVAWQPVTPHGVAAFAAASLRRLLLVQVLVAILGGATVAWFIHATCLPALRTAIGRLPDEGLIHQQTLSTPLNTTVTLVANPVLGIVVDLPRSHTTSLPSDAQIVFHPSDVEVSTRFGSLVLRYPKNWTIEFNRKELAPRLDAWTPAVLTVAGLAVTVLWLLFWSLLATLFFPIPIVVARYSDRTLALAASWKLAGAAFLPGALMMTAGLGVYGHGWITLAETILLAAVHFMVGWFYLVISPLALPRSAELFRMENPFQPPPSPTHPGSDSRCVPGKNPFASPEAKPPTGSSEPWES